ncbi:MAG: DUF3291 domain-containing protein [Cellvibrio sp.]|uniref:DUF3291 domain-containing protein n=1 Tax=Cellvibrio sp. TaxID=1965322 RepID=UPI0031ADF072
MKNYQLAQLNIAKMKEPLDSPLMADFVNNLDRINTLAENSEGFVWRLKDEGGDATTIRYFGDDVVVNMSVWTDVVSLSNYSFKSAHADIMRRKREWFDRMDEAYAVLWWIPTGHLPTVEEAKERLEHLKQYGPTPHAFVFKKVFPEPDAISSKEMNVTGACPVE